MAKPPTPLAERFWAKIRVTDNGSHWIWTGHSMKNGLQHEGKFVKPRHISWILYRGPLPDLGSGDVRVVTMCGVDRCVNPDCMEIMTRSDHMRYTGSSRKGRKFAVQPEKREAVRVLAKSGKLSQAEIARQLGVAQSTISRIVRGETR